MTLAQTLAENLRVLRALRGMSQLDLARAAGSSRRTIARLEAADIADPGVDQVTQLARALGVTLAMLAEGPLVTVTIPVPPGVRDSLADPAALDRMIRAV